MRSFCATVYNFTAVRPFYARFEYLDPFHAMHARFSLHITSVAYGISFMSFFV